MTPALLARLAALDRRITTPLPRGRLLRASAGWGSGGGWGLLAASVHHQGEPPRSSCYALHLLTEERQGWGVYREWCDGPMYQLRAGRLATLCASHPGRGHRLLDWLARHVGREEA